MTPDQRAQLEEAMTQALVKLCEVDGDGRACDAPHFHREDARAALDALLAFRFPCPEYFHAAFGPNAECATCHGSGEADSPRIALVEQVRGCAIPDGDAWRIGTNSPRAAGPKAVPVFVELVVPDQEDTKP